MKKLIKELPLLIIALTPVIYLNFIWNQLPEKVPIHWNINGEIDRYGNKIELFWISLFLPLGILLLMNIVPVIDPKNKIQKMGKKYENLKLFLVIFMSGLSLIIILTAKNKALIKPSYIFIMLSFLFIFFGNYMKTIKPNYFIGIRTPWTLENAEVWKITHQKASKLWFLGGILMMISLLIFPNRIGIIIFFIISLILVLYPTWFSYRYYKKLK